MSSRTVPRMPEDPRTATPSKRPGAPEPHSIICSLKSRYLGKSVETYFTIYNPTYGVSEIGMEFK